MGFKAPHYDGVEVEIVFQQFQIGGTDVTALDQFGDLWFGKLADEFTAINWKRLKSRFVKS